MRQVGAHRRDAPLTKMDAQDTRNFAIGDSGLQAIRKGRPHWQCMTESQQGVAPMHERREKFPGPTDCIPVFGEQQLDDRALFFG